MTSRAAGTLATVGVFAALAALAAVLLIPGAARGGALALLSEGAPAAAAATTHATPTATPDPNATWRAYSTFVADQMQTLTPDLQAVGTDCGNAIATDFNACYTDLQTLDDDIHKVQTAIATHTPPAPPCLVAADAQMRSSLAELDTGVQETMTAIRAQDIYTLDSADSRIRQANRDITTATAAFRSAPCITA